MNNRDKNQLESSESNDEENQYDPETGRRSKSQRSSKSTEKIPQSVIEKALTKTTSIFGSIGNFFKGGIDKIKDYVFQEDLRDKAIVERIRAKSARSQSKNKGELSDSS